MNKDQSLPNTVLTEDIDTGSHLMEHNYTEALTRFKASGYRMALGFTLVMFSMPWKPGVLIIHGVDVYMYLSTVPWVFMAFCWLPYIGINRYSKRWAALEQQGVRYVLRNDHYFRVRYYNHRDGSIQIENITREERLENHLAWVRHYKNSLGHYALELIFPVVVELVLVLGLYFIPTLPALQIFLASIGALPYLELLNGWKVLVCEAWFALAVLPKFMPLLICFLEYLDIIGGNQFVPGARPLDPISPLTTLETTRDEMVHGDMAFVPPSVAAKGMSS